MKCNYCDNELTTADTADTCSKCKQLQEEAQREWLFRPQSLGWTCPKCGSVYNPLVPECNKCNKYEVTV